jgi:hypothetical protein
MLKRCARIARARFRSPVHTSVDSELAKVLSANIIAVIFSASPSRSTLLSLAGRIARGLFHSTDRPPTDADQRSYTDRARLDSGVSWPKISLMMNDRVTARLVEVSLGHLWLMYAVYWAACGHYGFASVCAWDLQSY